MTRPQAMWVPQFMRPDEEPWDAFPYHKSWGSHVDHSGYVGFLEEVDTEPRRRIGFDFARFVDDHEPFPLVRQRNRLLSEPCP